MDYINIGNRKRRSPALRVSQVIDELLVVADYLNVARRAEEGDDLSMGSDRGSARLLLDCHQRLVALQDDLCFIRGCLERSAAEWPYPDPFVEQGSGAEPRRQKRLAITGAVVVAVAVVTAWLYGVC